MGKKYASFVVFYKKYRDKIFDYFWFRLNFDTHQAEDMTSEVFLKAFENYGSFNEKKSFQAWIYKIARNHLINHYRIRDREVPLEDAHDTGVEPVSKAVEIKNEIEGILCMINGMECYCREVLLLRFVNDMTNKEITEFLEKDEGAVRTQLSRCISKLRKKLKFREKSGTVRKK